MYKVEVWKRNDAEKLHTEYDFTTIEDAEKYIEEIKENNKEYFVVDDGGNVVISAEKLFSAACSGNHEVLEQYYDNDGKPNTILYEKFGKKHSLLKGAYNNNQWQTIDYLISQGECLTQEEQEEMYTEYMRITYMKKLINTLA